MQRTWMRFVAVWVLLGVGVAVASPPDPSAAPAALREWLPWLRAQHPEIACAHVDGTPQCVWSSELAVDAEASGARVTLAVVLDAAGPVALPGGTGAWPQDVTVDGRASPVLSSGGTPVVQADAGRHVIRGAIVWDTMPTALDVPQGVAQIALSVRGEAVAQPRRDERGRLRLGAAEADPSERTTRVELDVSRRIRDGVPVTVETHLALRVSGPPTELDLGAAALPGGLPVQLDTSLPARFDADGHLHVSARPGDHVLTFVARHEGPVSELRAPALDAPWPSAEFWVFVADSAARAVTPSGPPGVDPDRTTLPPDWRTPPAFRVSATDVLTLEELRRGDASPPPNQLTVQRELWLDLDGGGLTVRDQLDGTMHQGWRLDALPPLSLGHVAIGADQVVTERDGRAGVEVRSPHLSVTAESRLDGRPSVLPAVGWDVDASALGATLHLPPGWRLLTATGVDNLDGSVLDAWNLFDLFFVLVVALGAARLLGWPVGGVMLVALALARHELDAPQWIWALLLIALALARVVRMPWATATGRWSVVGLLVVLTLILVPWSIVQVRDGLFPALETPGGGYGGFRGAMPASAPMMDEVMQLERKLGDAERYGASSEAMDAPDDSAGEGLTAIIPWSKRNVRSLSLQYDPAAVAQTGPGVPTWSWASVPLTWSGPVGRDHTLRLVLVPPWAMLLVRLLRVGLFLGLAWIVAREAWKLRPAVPPSGAGTAVVALLLLSVGGVARAEAPYGLDAVEKALLAGPDCRPGCVSVPRARVAIVGERLTVDAEVHAGEASGWRLPGPASTWVPDAVLVDGRAADALLRDGQDRVVVRLAEGVHRVVLQGRVPAGDAVSLRWGDVPLRLTVAGEGWAIEGRRADGSAEPFLQLTREAPAEDDAAEDDLNVLAPWVEIERFVDLGVPWSVRTSVRRKGPLTQSLTLRVPLLPGERVTDPTYEGDGATRLVTLPVGRDTLTWPSTLEEADAVVLAAPEGVPWTESWRVSCSPVFACAFDGPPPVAHLGEGRWAPLFWPWEGETLTVDVSRPTGVDGITSTIDEVTYEVRPGRRQLEATLTLTARTSQGGTQVVTLPDGATLRSAQVDGASVPLDVDADHHLRVPLQPGRQTVVLDWLQEHPASVWDTAPAVGLGGPAVNATVTWVVPPERWLVWLWGPRWGPVPLYVVYLVLVLIGAAVLRRLPDSPLSYAQWVLLGFGMTQVPVVVPLIVALWLVAIGWRKRSPVAEPLLFNAVQLALVLLTVVTLGCLYAAVHAGLLIQPDMQVAGGGSSDGFLRWYVDRVDGALPQPAVLSLPMWTWRVLMLLWSLWMASSLVRWLRLAWEAFSEGGVVKPIRRAKAAVTPPAPPSEG